MANDAAATPPLNRDQPTQVRWIIFALACAVSWLLYLQRYAWGVIKPAFRDENLGLTDIDIGWLDSAFLAAYAIGQVPGGVAGDVLGPRGVLTGMILLWSIAAAGIAWTSGFWKLCGVRAAFGFAQAGGYPIVSKMTRNWFPLAGRTSLQGIITAFGRIGGACAAPIIATLLLGLCGFSWRQALYIVALPGVVLAVLFWLFARSSPREHPWVNEAEKDLVDGPTAPSTADLPLRWFPTAGSVLSLGALLVYAFASTFQDQLYVNWISEFLVRGRGLDAATMGLFTPLPLIGGAIGGIVGGVLNDHLIRTWGNRRWARTVVGCAGKGMQALLVALSLLAPDGRVAMVVLLAARFFGDWSLSTQWGAITDMGGRASGTVFGLVNTVGAIGGFAAGPIFGLLKFHYDWTGLFVGAVVMCMIASMMWLLIDCTREVVTD